MTYTKQVWADGQAGATPITSTKLNYIEDGISRAHDPQSWPVAFLRQTTPQTGLVGGWNLVYFNVADIDTHSGFNSATSLSRWTVPANQGGIYRVSAVAALVTGTANNWSYSRLIKNGALLQAGVGTGGGHGTTGGGSSYSERVMSLTPGEYLEFQSYSDAAYSTRVTTSDGISSWFAIERIR